MYRDFFNLLIFIDLALKTKNKINIVLHFVIKTIQQPFLLRSEGDRVGKSDKRIGIGVGSRRKVVVRLAKIRRSGARWVLIANTNLKIPYLKKKRTTITN